MSNRISAGNSSRIPGTAGGTPGGRNSVSVSMGRKGSDARGGGEGHSRRDAGGGQGLSTSGNGSGAPGNYQHVSQLLLLDADVSRHGSSHAGTRRGSAFSPAPTPRDIQGRIMKGTVTY